MVLGAPLDQLFHRAPIKGIQRVRIFLDPVEKRSVTNKGHLDRLNVAIAKVHIGERIQKGEIVHHRKRWCKRPYEILFPVKIDAVLNTDSRIGLA